MDGSQGLPASGNSWWAVSTGWERAWYLAWLALAVLTPLTTVGMNVAMVLVTLLSGWVCYQRPSPREPHVWPAWLLVHYAGLSALALSAWTSSAPQADLLVVASKYAKYLWVGLWWAAWQRVNPTLSVERLVQMMLAAVVGTAVFQMLLWWTGWQPLGRSVDHPFHDHILTSLLYAYTLFCCTLYGWRHPRARRWVWALAVGVVWAMLGINQGRTGVLALLPLLVLGAKACGRPKVVVWCVACLAVVGGWLVSVPNSALHSMWLTTWHNLQAYWVHGNEHTSLGIRLSLWRTSWHLIQEQPWWGYGLGAQRQMLWRHPHNTWLLAALQCGVVGWVWQLAWWGSWASLNLRLSHDLRPYGWAAWWVWFTASWFDDVMIGSVYGVGMLFTVTLTMVAAQPFRGGARVG